MEPMGPVLGERSVRWIKRLSLVTIGQVLAQGMGFLFLVMLAWWYSKNDYGQIAYLLGIAAFAGTFICAGVPVALARCIAMYKEDRERIYDHYSNGLVLVLIIMLTVSLVLFALYRDPLLILATLGFGVLGIYQELVRGYLHYGRLATFQLVGNSLKVALLVFLVYMFASLGTRAPLLAYGLAPFIALAAYMIICPLGLGFRRSAISARIMKEIGKFSFWVIVASVANSAALVVNLILLERDIGFTEVATYNVAYTLTIPLTLATIGVNLILYPKIAETDDPGRHDRMVHLSIAFSVGASLALTLLYYFFGNWAIGLLYPEQYGSSYLPMMVLCLGVTLVNVHTVFANYFEAVGRPHVTAIICIAAMAVTFALGLLLVPLHGALGAGYAFTAGYGVACLMSAGVWGMKKR